jgi:hypothetical protein
MNPTIGQVCMKINFNIVEQLPLRGIIPCDRFLSDHLTKLEFLFIRERQRTVRRSLFVVSSANYSNARASQLKYLCETGGIKCNAPAFLSKFFHEHESCVPRFDGNPFFISKKHADILCRKSHSGKMRFNDVPEKSPSLRGYTESSKLRMKSFAVA